MRTLSCQSVVRSSRSRCSIQLALRNVLVLREIGLMTSPFARYSALRLTPKSPIAMRRRGLISSSDQGSAGKRGGGGSSFNAANGPGRAGGATGGGATGGGATGARGVSAASTRTVSLGVTAMLPANDRYPAFVTRILYVPGGSPAML